MKVLKEVQVYTRRQFFKAMGVLGGTAVVSGIILKYGLYLDEKRDEYYQKRGAALYGNDLSMPIRKSHENPEIKEIYNKYFGEPLSEKSEHLLHTHYVNRYQKIAG